MWNLNKIHIKGNWVIEKAPSVEETGVRSKYCITCNKLMETEEISKLEYEYGDINKDFKINALDYMLLKRVYFNNYEADDSQTIIADINQNGSLDAIDYMLLKRKYFGNYS